METAWFPLGLRNGLGTRFHPISPLFSPRRQAAANDRWKALEFS